MKLQKLHEVFIEKAHRPMSFGSLPVRVREAEVPVIAIDRWKEAAGALYKTYRFRRLVDRNDFVIQLLAYEASTSHNAQIRIEGESIDLKVQTKSINKVSELDKEYAHYADVLFRELVYSSRNGNDG